MIQMAINLLNLGYGIYLKLNSYDGVMNPLNVPSLLLQIREKYNSNLPI